MKPLKMERSQAMRCFGSPFRLLCGRSPDRSLMHGKCLATLALIALLLQFASPSAHAGPWSEVETGLQIAVFSHPDTAEGPTVLVALRIDPNLWDFSLHTATGEGGYPLSLGAWAEKLNLGAAINSSMYLPDVRTSTGFLKAGEHVNNPRVTTKFGSFFVAAPDDPTLPQADLLDRTIDPWAERLPHYNMVVQNYRLISTNRRILWPQGGPEYSIAAVGQDGSGAILFLHCREPMTAHAFASMLLALPLDIHDVMYVEGGPQAGLLLHSQSQTRIWMGRHRADFWGTGNAEAPLPNILGARKRPETCPRPLFDFPQLPPTPQP